MPRKRSRMMTEKTCCERATRMDAGEEKAMMGTEAGKCARKSMMEGKFAPQENGKFASQDDGKFAPQDGWQVRPQVHDGRKDLLP